MKNSFRTLDDADVRGKRILVRVDLNVPMENGKVSDATRIDRILPTIRDVAGKGGKVILLAHFGRPKGAADEANSLKAVAPWNSIVLVRCACFSCCFAIACCCFCFASGRCDCGTCHREDRSTE